MMNPGNAACTEGLSKRLFETWLVEPGAGLSPDLSQAQEAGMKAMCFAFAKAVVAEVREAKVTGQIVISGVATYALENGELE